MSARRRRILGPYRLDARRCISYLTIELKGSIPVELRPLIGNRVYGCDDCQLVCPWNKFAQRALLPDFDVRNGLDSATLVELFGVGRRGIQPPAGRQPDPPHRPRALAAQPGGRAGQCGGRRHGDAAIVALRARTGPPSALVREHVAWALARHG